MGVFLLILELEDYSGERDIIVVKGLIFQEDIIIIMCLCLTIQHQNTLGKTNHRTERRYKSTIIVGDFNTPLSMIDRFSSVQFSRSVVSNSLRPHELQHTRPPCPSPTPGVHSNPRPSNQWCHPAISSSVVSFSSCSQSLPASESFPMIKEAEKQWMYRWREQHSHSCSNWHLWNPTPIKSRMQLLPRLAWNIY